MAFQRQESGKEQTAQPAAPGACPRNVLELTTTEEWAEAVEAELAKVQVALGELCGGSAQVRPYEFYEWPVNTAPQLETDHRFEYDGQCPPQNTFHRTDQEKGKDEGEAECAAQKAGPPAQLVNDIDPAAIGADFAVAVNRVAHDERDVRAMTHSSDTDTTLRQELAHLSNLVSALKRHAQLVFDCVQEAQHLAAEIRQAHAEARAALTQLARMSSR